MKQVTFTLRTLTPLFLAGADQTTAELRAPSFRGLMRYWLRALVGGTIEKDQERLEKVKVAEAEVFGSTTTGSIVRIRVSQPSNEPIQFNENISKPGTHQATGKGYLLWSMRLKKLSSRYYFEPNTSFTIHLSTQSTDELNFQKGIAALWLLTHLGGIGSRSRRCAGSLTATLYDGNAYGFPFTIPADVAELKSQIATGISTARSLYSSAHSMLSYPSFDILARNACRIWILQEDRLWETPDEVMSDIGESLQRYRGTRPLYKRKIFGLPLKGINGPVDRRASPLLLRVVELQGKKYVGLAVLFKTQSASIQLKDYDLIEKWIDTFSEKEEVKL